MEKASFCSADGRGLRIGFGWCWYVRMWAQQIFPFVNVSSLAIPTTICRSTKITKLVDTKLVETMLERSQETTSRLRASALKEMKALKAQIHLLLNPAVSRYRPTVPYSFLEGQEYVIWKYIKIALKSK